jgi:hypothetical protein
MKRRSRAALAAPTARDALFVKSDALGVEWKPLVGTATWSADTTLAKAAILAARSVRVTARAADDGKYAKYVGSGNFVLASASDDVMLGNGGAAAGSQGARGISPPGAVGSSAPVGAAGVGTVVGAQGASPAGAVGAQGSTSQGAAGAAGAVVPGLVGAQGQRGPARAELPAKELADASVVSGTSLYAPRQADGTMPTPVSISQGTRYRLNLSAFVLSYGVASSATLSWSVYVDGVRLPVDQRASQACPTSTYREYTLAATPPAGNFEIEFTSVPASSTASVSVLTL